MKEHKIYLNNNKNLNKSVHEENKDNRSEDEFLNINNDNINIIMI